jgi:hypothetical protein
LGKPLISDAAMLGMYATMQRLHDAKRDANITRELNRADRAALADRHEALAAALIWQIKRRDTVLVHGNDPLISLAFSTRFPDRGEAPQFFSLPGTSDDAAAMAAGMALQQKQSAAAEGKHPVVVALLREPSGLHAALALASEYDLSLLLVMEGEAETRVDVHRRLGGSKIPMLPVDDSDAVALCRVFQESMLRARNGWGSVVIYASRLPGSGDPIAAMEQHLHARRLSSVIR